MLKIEFFTPPFLHGQIFVTLHNYPLLQAFHSVASQGHITIAQTWWTWVNVRTMTTHEGHDSSIASPICQEGQNERTFLFLLFLPNFSTFFWFSTLFPIVSLFFLIFGKFLAVRGHSAPWTPLQWLCHWTMSPQWKIKPPSAVKPLKLMNWWLKYRVFKDSPV